jgi:hypothetical protein
MHKVVAYNENVLLVLAAVVQAVIIVGFCRGDGT